MMARLMIRFAPWLVAALLALAGWQYWISVTDERDAFRAALKYSQEQAEVLREHQQYQRQQIQTLTSAMAERDRALDDIADDMRASNEALNQLEQSDDEIRAWSDRPLPGGIAEWMQQLQSASGASARAHDAGDPASSDRPAAGASAEPDAPARTAGPDG